ncbi:MAG TPA: Calx-beta domain-containing protein, partial [Pyrinomonadaceae bacterium]|nr:Calx-beta domain-containing protein [Pyrinomonadaceae bacterium]
VSEEPATIQFSAPSYSAGEGSPQVQVNVTRLGDTSGPATVTLTTSDSAGSQACNVINNRASARCDYNSVATTLSFAAGEASKSVGISIINDAYQEGDETLTVSLANPSGAALGSKPTATVTIVDDDASPGPNPLAQAGFFVRQQYLDFLNREPDPSGFNFWTNQITSCGSDAQCTEVRRIDVSASFFLSIEFQNNGYLVERFYKVAYGNANGNSTFGGAHQLPVPVVRFNEFLQDTQRLGQGVIVLQAGWEQALENNKQAYALEFVQTSRFTAAGAFPTTLTPTEFVDKLNLNAGNVLSPGERTTAINLFGGAANSSNTTARAQAVRQVAEDTDLYNAEYNRAFVLAEYYGYLRRNPNDAPESNLDYTGYDFWLTKLNQFNGNYIDAEMVKAFLSSMEYNQRFAP